MAIPMRLAELEKEDVLGEMALFDERSRMNSSAILHHVCADLERPLRVISKRIATPS